MAMNPTVRTTRPEPVTISTEGMVTSASISMYGTKKITDAAKIVLKTSSVMWPRTCYWSLNVIWLFFTTIGVLTFAMPEEAFDAVATDAALHSCNSSLVVKASDRSDFVVPLMRAISVLLLLIASSVPCMWDSFARLIAMASLMTGFVFWIITIVEDDNVVFSEWFSYTALGIVLVPLLLSVSVLLNRIIENLS